MALLMTGVPVHASKMDDRIGESSVKKSYVFKTYLKDDDIKIESRDGAVTLTGIISEEYHKSLAQKTVAGLPGVKSVDNRLEIKGSPPTANSDAWLRDKVKVALLFHRNVNADRKDLATKLVSDVYGVKGVVNNMTVEGTDGTSIN